MTSCIFCKRASLNILAENEFSFVIRDKFPIRPLHTLIISKRHEPDSLALTDAELAAVFDLARRMRAQIMAEDSSVEGFNFGSNNGAVAGQNIMHAHFHLIPRRSNEAPSPLAQA